MSIKTETLEGTAAVAASTTLSPRRYSYSRRRWNGFDTWQEHVRRSADVTGVTFAHRHDRDLRRAIIAG